MTSRFTGGTILLVACLTRACTDGAPSKGVDPEFEDAPTLTLVDSMVLAESDSQYVGAPGGFLAIADGTYLIADYQTHTVHHYAADGRYIRRFGKRGHGPGEFSDLRRLALGGDSILYVVDGGVLDLFEFRTGHFIRQLPFIQKITHSSLVAADGRLFFDDVDHDRKTTVGALGNDGSIERGGPFPPPLGRSRILDQFFSVTHVAGVGGSDTLAVAVQNADRILVGSFRGGVFTTYDVARSRRMGAPAELLASINDENRASAEAALYKLSVPVAIARLSNGSLAYIAADEELVDNGLSARLYVSVIDTGARRSCVDAPVPVETDPHPYAVFRGDTLIVLSQEIAGPTRARLIVRKFTLDTADCDWIAEQSPPKPEGIS